MLVFDLRRGVGVGLVCASALIFQVFFTRILSVILTEQVILMAISFALLGMGAAATYVSTRDDYRPITDKRMAILAVALTVSYLAAFYLSSLLSGAYNREIDATVTKSGGAGLFAMLQGTMLENMWLLGAILVIPFGLFGLFVASVFRSARQEDYHRFYGADLVGASIGAMASMFALDAWGFQGGLGLTLITAATAAVLFAAGQSKAMGAGFSALAALAAAISVTPAVSQILEPRPASALLSRNFDDDRTSKELWSRWNAHSRVAQLQIDYKDGTRDEVYAHEGGDGWAMAKPAKPDKMYKLAATLEPKDILVLFAGVGQDMRQLDTACEGKCNITGVEINRDMVEHELAVRPSTRAFLAKPNIQLKVAEAREYLERDHRKYDSILLSWWGAGTSFFLGTSGQLAEHLYTKEAIESLMDHLTPDGTIVFFNGSKIQLVSTIATIAREQGMDDLRDRLVLMRPTQLVESNSAGFYDTPESMRMLFKPSGFTPADIAKVEGFARSVDMTIVVGPDTLVRGYEPYAQLIGGMPIAEVNKTLRSRYGIEVSVPTDARPFVNDLNPRADYFDIAHLIAGGAGERPAWLWVRNIFLFIVILSVISCFLVLAPVSRRGKAKWSPRNTHYLIYFAAIGAGFMLIEVGLLRKLGLLLGHPSYAISVVLASLILSTGVGSLVAPRLVARGVTLRTLALFVMAYLLAFVVAYPAVFPTVVALPFAAKAAISIMAIFPLGIALGQFFPRGLEAAGAEDVNLVPWAWAVNNTLSTIASAVAVYLSFPLGFDWILLLGGSVYLLILLTERRTASAPIASDAPIAISAGPGTGAQPIAAG
ncbi:hypothetical protein [Tsuneonella rigui]|uniref:hypothetical protein n=1 Tax=Tsuneonella rigui TaxID=1708790 RepID=UPI000F7F947E|nr:hypothetical protein [Tsuneonella rigui]